MGSRLALLILLCFLLAGGRALAEDSCLSCHDTHYSEWGTCISCHRGDPRSERKNIAHYGLIPGALAHFGLPESPVVQRGEKRLEEASCRRCHVIGGQGNRLAADLDRSTNQTAPEEIDQTLREPVLLMPNFHFSPQRRAEVINALYREARKTPDPLEDTPRIVHFDNGENREGNPFVKHCGACHSILTARYGGLGSGQVAPNLSGLLTPFYPPNYKEKEAWTPESLKKWLENPRKARPVTGMAPVPLKEKEWKELVEILNEPGVVITGPYSGALIPDAESPPESNLASPPR